jgi:hypothetical protein
MFLLDGKPLSIDTPFQINGTSYPSNWLRMTSIEEKNAVGITEVPDPEPYDDRFWWGHDNPKDLDMLKTNWTAQVKDTANKLLSQTDWMYIRKIERNVDVPADTVTYRAAVIAECTRLATAMAGSADVPALIAVVTAQGWPVNGQSTNI